MVAILCGHGKYHNQFLNEDNKWITDMDSRAVCTKNTLEILEYCRKVNLFCLFVCLLFLMVNDDRLLSFVTFVMLFRF